MARRVNVNDEPYNGYLAPSQIPQLNPVNMFYTTDEKCKRNFCAVCGDCHPVNTHKTQRITEWLTGTTLPDALYRSSEANIIDNFTQLRFKQARHNDDEPCQQLDTAIEHEKKLRHKLHPCDTTHEQKSSR